MDISQTNISCGQCGNTLINDIPIPPSPHPHLLRTHHALAELEAIEIKNYISTVEHLIDTLDAQLGLVKRNRDKMQKALAGHQNLIAPIRRVPTEILTEIFWLSCPAYEDCSSRAEKIAPFFLAQICGSWRDMILGMPKLWSQIHLDSHRPWGQTLVKEWIQRSGDAPLAIAIDANPSSLTYGRELSRLQSLSSVIPFLLAESNRWKTASIRLSGSMMSTHFASIKGRLSSLESLSLEPFPYASTEDLRFDCFATASKLRRLHLGPQIPFLCIDNIPLGLTHMELINVCNNVTMCLIVLGRYPNLVELCVGGDGPWSSYHTESSLPITMIYLRHLQRLDLNPRRDPSAIFDHLTAPSLRHLSLNFDDRDTWLTGSPFLSFLQRSSSCLTTLKFCIKSFTNNSACCDGFVECLRLLPILTNLELDDNQGLFIAAVIQSLTFISHQPPLLPTLEQLKLTTAAQDPHLLANMVGSRCSLAATGSCSRIKAVRVDFWVDLEPGHLDAWAQLFETYKKQGLRISVIHKSRAGTRVILL